MEDFNTLWPAGLFLIAYTGLLFSGFNWMIKNQTKQINIKFDQVDIKFDQVNATIKQINEKLDNHITDTNKKIDNLSNRIDDTNKKIDSLSDNTNKKIDNLSNHFDLRFDRLYELLLQDKKTG